jgi:hypothetical protein
MQEEVDLLGRVIIKLTGKKYIGEEAREGWKKPLPHYLFICPVHGLVKSYPSTHKQVLICPKCIEEMKRDSHQENLQVAA